MKYKKAPVQQRLFSTQQFIIYEPIAQLMNQSKGI